MRVPRDPMSDGPRPPVWTPPVDAAERGATGVARPAAGAGQVLPFRRRTGLPVRRRSRLASFARPFLTAVAIVGIPAAALWWSATSPRFALSDLEVRGSQRVDAEWVRQQLAHLVGHNLVWMPLGSVEHTLAGHPWVDGVEVTKELPDRLRVVVVERQPVAIVEGADRSSWIDADGAVIAPVESTESSPGSSPDAAGGGLLRLRWNGVADAPAARRRTVLAAGLDAVRELALSAPAWGQRVTRVTILGDEDFRLEGEALPFPLLVRQGEEEPEIASRLRRLEELLPEIRSELGSRFAQPISVDLRFRHRIVVRPAVAETAQRQERGA